MDGRIARPGQRFSDARPLTLLAALSTGNHVIPVRSLSKRLHCTPTPSPPHFSIPASSTRSRFRHPVLKWIRPKSAALGLPPAPGRGKRSSNVAACLTPILRRTVTPGLSLPSSSTQCLSSHSASTPRWRLTVPRVKTPKCDGTKECTSVLLLKIISISSKTSF